MQVVVGPFIRNDKRTWFETMKKKMHFWCAGLQPWREVLCLLKLGQKVFRRRYGPDPRPGHCFCLLSLYLSAWQTWKCHCSLQTACNAYITTVSPDFYIPNKGRRFNVACNVRYLRVQESNIFLELFHLRTADHALDLLDKAGVASEESVNRDFVMDYHD